MTDLAAGTWVLVCDSEKALFLRNDVDAQDPDLNLQDIKTQENPSDIDQSANRPGRMNDSGPGQRSALDDTDWHELAKERFADELAEILYIKAHRGDFDKLIIVADPRTLGALRPALHSEVSSKVIAEIDKTMTNHPVDKIETLVKAELAQRKNGAPLT
ncbi:host attachment family protein [Roseovarius aestuarii]|nr:host attachment family protein [Roseovarius aestuarii]